MWFFADERGEFFPWDWIDKGNVQDNHLCAGISSPLPSKPELPPVDHGGDCFPICIYCRSPTEAVRAWQILQPIAEVMDGKPNDEVATAFLTNVVVARMFEHDERVEFYATFFGLHRRPVLFLSWYSK